MSHLIAKTKWTRELLGFYHITEKTSLVNSQQSIAVDRAGAAISLTELQKMEGPVNTSCGSHTTTNMY